MKGSVTKYRQKNGRVSWGYNFRPGKDSAGKWIRVTRQGFETRRQAEEELSKAINDHSLKHRGSGTQETFAEFFDVWMRSMRGATVHQIQQPNVTVS